MVAMPKKQILARVMIGLFIVASLFALIYTFWRSEVVFDGERNHLYLKYYVISAIGLVASGMILLFKNSTQVNIIVVVCSAITGLYIAEIGLHVVGERLTLDWVSEKKSFQSRHDPKSRKLEALAAMGELAKRKRNRWIQRSAEAQGIFFDTRTKLEVIEELRARGLDPVPQVPMGNYYEERKFPIGETTLLSLGGISNRLTVYCNESGEWATYNSDRFGFNNPDTEWDEPQIMGVLVGDSFTHGACVNEEDNLAGQLRRLVGQSFLNLGMDGAGPFHQLGTLIEYGLSRQPKDIFWFYFEGNDLAEMISEGDEPILIQYLNEGYRQELALYQDEIDQSLLTLVRKAEQQANASLTSNTTAFRTRLRNVVLLSYIRHVIAFDQIGKKPSEGKVATYIEQEKDKQVQEKNKQVQKKDKQLQDQLTIFQRYAEILARAQELVKAFGGQLYFVYLPEFYRYKSENVNDHEAHLGKENVIKAVQQWGIPIIDIHKLLFSEHPDPYSLFPFEVPGHYNAEGYKGIAEAIVVEARIFSSQQ